MNHQLTAATAALHVATRKPAPRQCDLIWTVLTAASDLRDEPMMATCQRAIDATLRGDRPMQRYLDAIGNYFR